MSLWSRMRFTVSWVPCTMFSTPLHTDQDSLLQRGGATGSYSKKGQLPGEYPEH